MIKSNCYGYALYKLGLQEKDEQPKFLFSSEWFWQTFERVAKMKDADAVAWLSDSGYPYHMAIVDKRKDRLSHRYGFGARVQRVSAKFAGISYDGMDRAFLKLKKQAPIA